MDCAESLRTQAYFDGELDASSAMDIERHLERCASCRGRLQDLEDVRSVVREMPSEPLPPVLRRQIDRVLDREDSADPASRSRSRRLPWRWNPFWAGTLMGVAGSAAAAFIALILISPSQSDALLHDLTANQVRSLMASHLIDVASSDQHTVKPWFAGHTDLSPAVADFAQQGYRLIGGRADYLAGQRSAVVVYQHGRHVINVFVWRASKERLPLDTTRSGYHMSFWRVGDLDYCAVSDTSWPELRALTQLLQASARGGLSPEGP
jgi:anti-sigma factor RsiW